MTDSDYGFSLMMNDGNRINVHICFTNGSLSGGILAYDNLIEFPYYFNATNKSDFVNEVSKFILKKYSKVEELTEENP